MESISHCPWKQRLPGWCVFESTQSHKPSSTPPETVWTYPHLVLSCIHHTHTHTWLRTIVMIGWQFKKEKASLFKHAHTNRERERESNTLNLSTHHLLRLYLLLANDSYYTPRANKLVITETSTHSRARLQHTHVDRPVVQSVQMKAYSSQDCHFCRLSLQA